MRLGDKKIFLNKITLYEMINLRRIGLSSYSLAIIYNCDRNSIESKCNRYGILPEEETFRIERISSDILAKTERPRNEKTKWTMIDGERVCLGRSYKDYL